MVSSDLKEIKIIRKNLGITQKELAKLSNVSQSLIAKIESDSIEPTYTKVQEIFLALNTLSETKKIKASDILNKKLIVVSPDDKLKKAAKLMQKNEISQLPVIFENNIIGIITESNILKHILEEKEFLVKEIMDESPPIISMKTNIDMISQILVNYSIVIVQDKGKIKGIITKSDLISKKYSN